MRIFFTILFVIFLISYLLRLFAPYILKWFVHRVEKKMNAQFGGQTQQTQKNTRKKEGKITIEQTEKIDKKVDGDIGEYVDYEEEK